MPPSGATNAAGAAPATDQSETDVAPRTGSVSTILVRVCDSDMGAASSGAVLSMPIRNRTGALEFPAASVAASPGITTSKIPSGAEATLNEYRALPLAGTAAKPETSPAEAETSLWTNCPAVIGSPKSTVTATGSEFV